MSVVETIYDIDLTQLNLEENTFKNMPGELLFIVTRKKKFFHKGSFEEATFAPEELEVSYVFHAKEIDEQRCEQVAFEYGHYIGNIYLEQIRYLNELPAGIHFAKGYHSFFPDAYHMPDYSDAP